ncbi:unnamed protein product [Adineta steineri]|uniref:Tetratricopeptide repeat protein n=1 Tax=Adineta steineri TaxID=433720 RepID=A0A814RRE1_9BILA|nr:unnamed protein product [Adineta steineri]
MDSSEDVNLELLTLIWLDNNVNTDKENVEFQDKFRSSINYLRTFDNCSECEDYIINKINNKQENIILIVSGRLAEQIIHKIHHLKHILAIFIFCFNKDRYESLATQYKKIRRICTGLTTLLNEINDYKNSGLCQINESVEIILNENKLFEFLLEIKRNFLDKRYFLEICSKQYQNNFNQIKDFEHFYLSSNALNEFFNQTFLYQLLIKSLHRFNIEMIYFLRFFIQDIYEQTNNLPTISTKSYRGQLMRDDQIDLLKNSIEKSSIRLNTILIAKKNYGEILKALKDCSNGNNYQRVLFEIDMNDIGKEYEQYVIYPITSYFNITSIYYENNIYFIKIIIGNKKNFIKKDFSSIEFAQYLREINNLNQSQKFFELLLKQFPSLNSQCYDGLARIAQDKGLYEISLEYYFKSLDTVSNQLKPFILNNIGCAYDYLEEYDKALKYYSQSLTLMKNTKHQSMSLNNMAIIYAKHEQFNDAFDCFQQSLIIRKKYLPDNHPDIAIIYINLGVIWSSLHQFDDAMKYFHLALKSFSSNHYLDFYRAIIYQNMGDLFLKENQFDQSLKYYQDAFDIFQQIRSIDHPNLSYIQQQIQLIKQQK